jgi:hypothetical protein
MLSDVEESGYLFIVQLDPVSCACPSILHAYQIDFTIYEKLDTSRIWAEFVPLLPMCSLAVWEQ